MCRVWILPRFATWAGCLIVIFFFSHHFHSIFLPVWLHLAYRCVSSCCVAPPPSSLCTIGRSLWYWRTSDRWPWSGCVSTAVLPSTFVFVRKDALLPVFSTQGATTWNNKGVSAREKNTYSQIFDHRITAVATKVRLMCFPRLIPMFLDWKCWYLIIHKLKLPFSAKTYSKNSGFQFGKASEASFSSIEIPRWPSLCRRMAIPDKFVGTFFLFNAKKNNNNN